MVEIPLGAADKLIRRSGNLRVSSEAKRALAELLEHAGSEMARKAADLAAADKRKMVQPSDIQKAKKEVWD